MFRRYRYTLHLQNKKRWIVTIGVYIALLIAIRYWYVHTRPNSSLMFDIEERYRRSRMRNHLIAVTFKNDYEQAQYKIAWSSSPFIDHAYSTVKFFTLENEYPPFNTNFNLWKELQNDPIKFQWYTRCDYDTFLNGINLKNALAGFDTKLPHYLGKIGTGRPQDIKTAHIEFPFVMGGTCETVNRVVLDRINIEKCRTNSNTVIFDKKDRHSDVEFARCLKNSGIHASALSIIKNVYSPQIQDVLEALSITPPNSVIAFHPIKSPLIRMAYERDFRSLRQPLANQPCSISPIHTYYKTSCEAGKWLKLGDRCATVKPRCEVPIVHSFLIKAVHIIGFDATNREVPSCILSDDANVYYHTPIPVNHSQYLAKGELSLSKTYMAVLREAIARDAFPFLILEEDFMVRRDICKQWSKISSRCMYSAIEDGILLLGHSVYNPHVWDHFGEHETCHDLHKFAYGAFANVYSKVGATSMLLWLNILTNVVPIDNFYSFIVNAGVSVRALSPPLVIADVNHNSTVNPSREANSMTVDKRHKVHKWGNRNLFTYYDF